MKTEKMNRIWLQALLVCAAMCSGLMGQMTWAQTATKKSHIQLQEERTRRCPEGQYGGPHEGARSFYQDPYVWFVSREFANRFCMPDSYIDDSLKGALALAVRLKNEEFTLCGFVGGPGSCPPKQKLLIDVYIDNRKVKIPKADPSVKYYSGTVQNSGWLAGISGAKADRRRKGEITEVEGERRPFSPIGEFVGDTRRFRTNFIFMGARSDWVTGAAIFGEDFYRSNWIEGIDLITLNGFLLGFQELRNPDQQIQTERRGNRGYAHEEFDRTDPIRHWSIGVISGPDLVEKYGGITKTIPYPSGFDHVIVLPHKVAQIIYQYDWKQGETFFNSVKNAIQPGSAPTK
jgi:hypothetical protein